MLQVLQNLVNLLGIPSSLNFAVMGSVILLGVLADQQIARLRKHSLAQTSRARSTHEHGGAGLAADRASDASN